MPKLFIVSDSHGATGYLRLAADRVLADNFSEIIHLGDVVSDARTLSKWIGRKVITVAGNCDILSAEPRARSLDVDAWKIFLTHGDTYRVKSSLDALSYRAEEMGYPIALYGHTHRAFAGYVGSTLLLNPGALCDGRYAILTLGPNGAVPKLFRIS